MPTTVPGIIPMSRRLPMSRVPGRVAVGLMTATRMSRCPPVTIWHDTRGRPRNGTRARFQRSRPRWDRSGVRGHNYRPRGYYRHQRFGARYNYQRFRHYHRGRFNFHHRSGV